MRARPWFAIALACGFGVGCSSSATTDLAAADGSVDVDADVDASVVDDAAPEATSDAEADAETTDAQSSDAAGDAASDARADEGGGGDAGPCDGKADGAPCDDGDACTKTDACQAGVCVGRDPVVCTALDACHVAGTCAPSTGICSNPTKADGTACGASTCANAGSELAPRCAGGTCGPTTVSCAGFACSGGGCVTACTPATNAGCDASHYCASATTCSPTLGLGSACSYGFWCSSGNCQQAQDTKRCATAGLTCPPCSVVNAAGTACVPASVGSDPKQNCTAQCAQGCNGAGACEPAPPGSPCGGDYVCNGTSTSCPTSCSANSGCAQGSCCQGGTCGFAATALACGPSCTDCAAQIRNSNCIGWGPTPFCGCMGDVDCGSIPGSCNTSTHLCQ